MKKVMIGILILIPILILVIVVAVSNLLQIAAWIAVDDISVLDKSGAEAESITVEFASASNIHSFYDYVSVKVFPDYANRYTIEWRISGNIVCTDETYKKLYDQYLAELEVYNRYMSDVKQIEDQISAIVAENAVAARDFETKLINVDSDDTLAAYEKEEKKAELTAEFNTQQAARDARQNELNAQKEALGDAPDVDYVAAPAYLVDDNGQEVTSNTTGKFKINAYCIFTIVVQVESINKTLTVTVEGYNAESIRIVNVGEDDSTLRVGERMLVEAKYHPISSIVTKTKWHSDHPEIASVDANGVITAHAVGEANITVKANRYDDPDAFPEVCAESSAYTVHVTKGLSKFGSSFSTSLDSFKLSDIGILQADVRTDECDGCDIHGETVNMTASIAHIVTEDGTVTVSKCEDGDISIENADIYSSQSGYVFAVSGLPLKLKAVWTDVLKEGAPTNAVWSAQSDGDVVKVENGSVTASGSGYAQITVSLGGKTAKVLLNVQVKLVSITLRTSDESLKVGLALETVFAAEKYVNSNKDDNSKLPNSTLINIIGAPKKTDTDDEESYAAKLKQFYNAYNYEVSVGAEYAHFSDSEPNRLIFEPSALKGKVRQTITVTVSAKYPRYESDASLTTAAVNINVVYGVEVSDIAQLRKASKDQENYAKAPDNMMPKTVAFDHTNYSEGREDRYLSYDSAYSRSSYAIVFGDDIAFEFTGTENYKENGQTKTRALPQIDDDTNIDFYGDVYGNGHRLQAERNQLITWCSMTEIVWSKVTVSNLNFRANKMEKDGTLSADETDGLPGECLQLNCFEEYEKVRIKDVKVEFCIFENARRVGVIYNADCTFDGIIVRNMSNTAFYVPAKMETYTEGNEIVTYPRYAHVNLNNCVFSNCIGSVGSFSFEKFTVVAQTGSSNPFPNCKAGDGRFIRKDPVANAEYFKQNFLSQGITHYIRQTGFLDIYNWTNVKNANLIDTGDSDTNKLLGSVANGIIKENPEFAKCRYVRPEDNSMYFHMGFLSSGISFSDGIMDEPIYLDITFEDNRFAEPILTRNVQALSTDVLTNAAEHTISLMEIRFYGYSDKSDITPTSTFEINSDFINHLHGKKKS